MQAVGRKKKSNEEQSVYLTGDMILFHVIDLLCHLFPPFFIFCGAQEAASVIDEPGVHFSIHTLLGSLQCNEQWVLFWWRLQKNINVIHLLNMCPLLYVHLRSVFLFLFFFSPGWITIKTI